jgi:hypothetical protein
VRWANPAHAEIAETVYVADFMDEKYDRPELEDLDSIVCGMQPARLDEALTYYTNALYDGLYACLSWEVL